jgi:hypothetical protein
MRRAVLVVAFLLQTRALLACSCGFSFTLTGEVAASDGVFTATILSKRVGVTGPSSGNAWIDATAQVGRVWKGNPPAIVRISTGLGGGDCGIHLDRGATYLVFARGDDGGYGTGACSWTRPREKASALIAELGPPLRNLGGEDAAPGAMWRQQFFNVEAAFLVLATWPSLFVHWPHIAGAIAVFLAVAVMRRRFLVAMAAWLISLGDAAYRALDLEFPIVLWVALAALVLVLAYVAVRAGAAVIVDSRAFTIAVPIVLAVLLIWIERPLETELFWKRLSLLGLLLIATHALVIAFVVLAILWRASMLRGWYVAAPAAAALALLAFRVTGPWVGLSVALQ